jgi:hypothetical protein
MQNFPLVTPASGISATEILAAPAKTKITGQLKKMRSPLKNNLIRNADKS